MNVNFSLKHVPAVLLVVFLSVAGAWAQGGAAPAGPAPTKIVALDVRGAIQATAEGKEALIELQSKFAPKQTDLQNLQKQPPPERRGHAERRRKEHLAASKRPARP